MAAPFDATSVLASAPAVSALQGLAAPLRRHGYQNQPLEGPGGPAMASAVALGRPAPRAALDEAAWPGAMDALAAAGAGDVAGDHFLPRFALFGIGDVVVVVPADGADDPGRIYFGRDSLWLADLATRVAPARTRRAADLGTGAGTVAALLGRRYDTVVGTELLGRTAACAALTMELNRRADGRLPATVCVTDVAAGLERGSFDLVAANPPWVPDEPGAPVGILRTFADGGPTGFELPRRFAMEAASLLAPGGVAVVLALDVVWAGGQRPLAALARGLQRLRYEVAVTPTEASEVWAELEAGFEHRFPDVEAVTHVALLVHRPEIAGAPTPGSPAAVADARSGVVAVPAASLA